MVEENIVIFALSELFLGLDEDLLKTKLELIHFHPTIQEVKRKKKNYIKFSGRVQHGKASYYWKPQRIACSRTRRYNPNLMVAAHKTLKCGTMVRVTNKRNGLSVVVKIDDRGPYISGRIVDLSVAAAKKIRMRRAGVVPVKLEVLWPNVNKGNKNVRI